MGRLVVRFSHQKNQLFTLPEEGEVVIGRGDTATLLLPNVSVSREHCRIVVGRQRITLEDADSQNGTRVNGVEVEQHELRSGDEIGVGKFTLVYLGTGRDDRFYKGRYVGYLPEYDPGSILPDTASTFALSADALKAMAATNHVVENARLLSTVDSKRFWYPEDRGLTFGSKGMVTVTGWFTGGIAAEVVFSGKRHVLERRRSWAHVSVNGVRVDKRPLRHGDRVQIGRSTFRYSCPESKAP